jgi:hypothetical protein
MPELIKAKSEEKSCPARKSRKREGNGDFKKESIPPQTPRRSSKRRLSQPIFNSKCLSGEKTSSSPLPRIPGSPPFH